MKDKLILILLMVVIGMVAGELSDYEAGGIEILPVEKQSFVVAAAEEVVSFGWPIAEDDYIALSSPFGKRALSESGGFGDGFHRGVDMYGTWHARVVAVGDGVVTDHWPPPNGYYRGHPILGGVIEITLRTGHVVRYAHLSVSYVHEGDVVEAGQVVGRQGKTGKTDSEHLHFEIREDGELVNPLQFISLTGR